ncbi:2-methylaconitate cis-trans isomerase PrpF family protein [Afipia sp. GAS231]|uniref:2-methylaconitate cis-trans isomerase PrpF family protein n=1 Tax=Afipia sp. GAS231 TaxID=1882747 RepID=UPI00087AB14F|nr:PrpF domain-containing protein [Afipia sp. GAS231]SDN55635.1 methylitaconate delta2-delta3-isomerase [Afipia sp. GAS231]
MVRQIRCVLMRGGTSKAVFLKESDLPIDEAERSRTILSIFGSPDRRQIDGLGGADPLTSKLAVIGPVRTAEPRAAGTHLTYTFGQVEIAHPEIDWLSLCGNISSAVGAFAVYEGYVTPHEPMTQVRVFNTNLSRVLTIEVPVRDGRPLEQGDYSVPGVPGTGAKILIDFSDTAGAATGALLPTGRPVDRLTIPDVGEIDVSLVDIGNAHVFVRAGDLGLRGTESAAQLDADHELRARLERIRGAAAERMGMIAAAARSREASPATPILGIVSPPASYRDENGGAVVNDNEVDLVSRLMFMQQTHKTYAGTSTVCTGVASRLTGTLVHEVTRLQMRQADTVRIGHPAGVIETETRVEKNGAGQYVVRRATLGRTARRIMEGYVFVPDTPHPAVS